MRSNRLVPAALTPMLILSCAQDAIRTNVPEAREAYLAGQAAVERRLGRADADSAVSKFKQATELDPDFAQAWAGLARARVWLEFNQGVPDQLAPAEEAIDRAEELEPEAVETQIARGYVAYYGYRDYERALSEFLAAERAANDNADVAGAIGNIYRRQGNLEDAINYYERRTELDSTYAGGVATLAGTYAASGQYDAALRAANHLIQLGDVRGQYSRFWAHLDTGDTTAAWAVIPDIKNAEGSDEPGYFDVVQAVLRRDDAAMSALIDSIGLNDVDGDLRVQFTTFLWRSSQLARGRAMIDSWKSDLEAGLEWNLASPQMSVVQESGARSTLALLEALQGNATAAMAHADRVVELDPLQADAWVARGILSNLALSHAALGHTDQAMEILRDLTVRGLGPSSIWMELHPSYDALRDHPDFGTVLDLRRQSERQAS